MSSPTNVKSLSNHDLPAGFGQPHESARPVYRYSGGITEAPGATQKLVNAQRFNGKGELTAVRGIPVKGHHIADENDLISEDTAD